MDTGYVLKKLLLLFFPFTHKVCLCDYFHSASINDLIIFCLNYQDWSLRYRQEEPIAPKDDFNAPDLYIPTMSFVTYILVAGYLLGLNDKFSPEQLGIQASSVLGWFLFEIIITFFSLYVMNLTSALGFFHLMALSGYKFVFMITALLFSILFSQLGYYLILLYGSVSLGFFLLRSLHMTFETNISNHDHVVSTRNTLYLATAFCLFQPLSMYILTRHLIVNKH